MKAPFSRPPEAPRSWWGTWSGQAFLVVLFVATIVIFFGIMGWVGPPR